VTIDSQTTDDKGITNFTLVRKLDTLPFPPDLQQRIKQERHSNITTFLNERMMLEAFISKLH